MANLCEMYDKETNTMTTMHSVTHLFQDCQLFTSYIVRQMENCTPGITQEEQRLIESHIPGALERMEPILRKVRGFEPGKFNHISSLQYTTFLYFLSNEIWLDEGFNNASEKLFLLNRALNSIDLYYKLRLPRTFVIAHALGAVMVNTTYGENFVFFQHTTVGRLGNKVPTIGENVILFPNSMVLGDSTVGSNSVISAGTIVSNMTIPDDSLVFSNGPTLIVKPRRKNYIELFIHSD